MAELSLGLQYYLLILAPSLVDELDDYGFACAVATPGLEQHEVEQAFFAARKLTGSLPSDPGSVTSAGWGEMMEALHRIRRVLDVLEKDTFEAVAREARAVTADKARQDLQEVFEQKRAEGEVDFRLHGLAHTEPADNGHDPAVREAFRRKRADRLSLLLGFDAGALKAPEQVIFQDARSLAKTILVDGKADNRVDALLAMAAVFIEMASMRRNPAVPEAIQDTFDRMSTKAVMALGAIVYRDEYQELKQALALSPLPSDL